MRPAAPGSRIRGVIAGLARRWPVAVGLVAALALFAGGGTGQNAREATAMVVQPPCE